MRLRNSSAIAPTPSWHQEGTISAGRHIPYDMEIWPTSTRGTFTIIEGKQVPVPLGLGDDTPVIVSGRHVTRQLSKHNNNNNTQYHIMTSRHFVVLKEVVGSVTEM